ncbi:MAG: hypothetical protein DLM69_11660, partial [Candidatus Chloroheliales bacterium]
MTQSRHRLPLALLLTLLLLAACDSSATPAPSLSSLELLKQALANMKAMQSYHIDERGSVAGVQVTLSGDFDVANQRYSTSETYTSAGSSQQVYDIIIVGNDRYTRDRTGASNALFTKDISGTNDLAIVSLSGMWAKPKSEDIDKAGAALRAGSPYTEPIDGADTRHLVLPSSAIPGLSFIANADPSASNIDLWLSTDASPTVRQM